MQFNICTIVTPDHLAFAITLMESVRTQHPEARRTVFILADTLDQSALPKDLAQWVLCKDLGKDLGIADYRQMAFSYTPFEFSVALKPFALAWLIAQSSPGVDGFVLLDADICLYRPLTPIIRALETAELALTPHRSTPRLDHVTQDLDLLRCGVYNSGFVALRASPATRRFLDWWADRLCHHCVNAPDQGSFVDQKWLDLAPSLVPATALIGREGCNIAYWNLDEQPIGRDEQGWTAGDNRLIFYHFSGIELAPPYKLSRHRQIGREEDPPLVTQLADEYRAKIARNGHADYRERAYDYGRLACGAPINPAMRAYYRLFQRDTPSACADPFQLSRDFFDEAETHPRVAGFPPISRLMRAVWQQREDVRYHTGLATLEGRQQFRALFLEFGPGYGVPDPRIPPDPAKDSADSAKLEEPAALWQPPDHSPAFRSLQVGYDLLAAEHARVLQSLSWRITAPLRRTVALLRRYVPRSLRRLLRRSPQALRAQDSYQQWVAQWDTLKPQDRTAITAHIDHLPHKPVIAVLMPVYNTNPEYLRLAILSVFEQLYPHWELCIADDASTNPETLAVLEEFAARDHRVKLTRRATNGHISAASNAALELVTAPFTALLDHDDLLAPHALYMVAVELATHQDADLIYSDEDKIDATGLRHDPYFKSDWNEELLLGQNFISHLGVYRTRLIRELGGFRLGFEGSQDYDLALRVTAATEMVRIRHIPHILYHWRVFKESGSFSTDRLDHAVAAARRAIEESLHTRGERDFTLREVFHHYHLVCRALPQPEPQISLIIPTRDRLELLRPCIEGVLHRTDYPNLEIIIIDNGSELPETLAYFAQLAQDPRVTILQQPGPFNYSRLNNEAVRHAKGELICLLNNDIDVINPGWLRAMAAHAIRPKVGAVGAKLLYADGTVQHGGVFLGIGGVANHAHHGYLEDNSGYFGRAALAQQFSAVTAACLVMRRALFLEIGGFEEDNLAVAFNDVDLCLRLRTANYDIIWTPEATLHHYESASRGRDETPESQARFQREHVYIYQRWGWLLTRDPFYNPNLSLGQNDFSLASPPRIAWPWTPFRAHDAEAQTPSAYAQPNA